jgi:hypothetical protein
VAYPPTTLTVNYGTSSTATLTIPAGCSYSDYVQGIMRNGFWFPQPQNAAQSQTQTFTPASEITSITAQ